MSTANLIEPEENGGKKYFMGATSNMVYPRNYRVERDAWIGFLALVVGVALFVAGAVMLGIGISKSKSNNSCPNFPASSSTILPPFEYEEIAALIQEKIDVDRIRDNLRNFTIDPHQAGTTANIRVADSIMARWREAGLQNVHTVAYDVLLSYPDFSNPNFMSITDQSGKEVYKSEGVSPPIIPAEQNSINAGIQWLAYSPNGTVTGDVVYCGHGTEREFQYLQSHGISLKGRIALLRYGGSFRGNKVALAQQNGAVAAILFSDPAEVAPYGTLDKDVYPNTVYMPQHSVQRGTLHIGNGDVLSPLYAGKPNLWKTGSVEKARAEGDIPSIPAIPISYTSAMALLSRLDGAPAPSAWKGGLDVTYNLGPGLKDNLKTTITVNGHFEVKQIRNVIGYINGIEEPDRYVILGNHYDAWTYGALDPNSGTSILAEVARATMQVVNETGWRPARSLMFAAWDAEEYGLLGSTEFVEDFAELLTRRAVAYLNMDCLQGNQTIFVESVPSLQDQVIQTAKRVKNPRKDEKDVNGTAVFDAWLHYMKDPSNPDIPQIPTPSGGSDQKSFMEYLGVPSMSFSWTDMDKHQTYPLYHTLYETPFINEHLMDIDNFAVHKATAQFWIEMAVRLVDGPTIPYSLHTLATRLQSEYIPDLATSILSLNMTYTKDGYTQLQQMATSSAQFEDVTRRLEAIPRPRSVDFLTRSRYNDRLINVERCFVNPRGTPDDASARHVLFSISKTNSYAGRVMQQVYKVLDDMADAQKDQLPDLGNELANQISIVHNSILCALGVLADFI
uniref:N-acetylated-alpha-linked acidic dipeptidase 2 n=1 Tax=Haemonchus contortus TaxID=6289 RepID=A0A7I4Y289_HAECO